jgi:hypothetical protein
LPCAAFSPALSFIRFDTSNIQTDYIYWCPTTFISATFLSASSLPLCRIHLRSMDCVESKLAHPSLEGE